MRVAFVAPAPWHTVSGGYVYDRAIVAGLCALGHQVDVVAIGGRHPLPDEAARAAAAAAWAGVADDAVMVIDGLCLPSFQAHAADFETRHVVGLIHHPTALETGRTEAARDALLASERDVLPRLHRAIVTSADTQRRLVGTFAVPAPRVAVVEPGTKPASRSSGPAGEACMILSVATLLPRKGHDVLLRALSRLLDLDWTLVIAGGAPDAEHADLLHGLAAELCVAERVRFAGEMSADALTPLWEGSAIFALATWYEGYGMAIAEALRRGLPVAVTNGGAAASLVGPECSVVCPPGDHAGLSRALRRMIYDRELRTRMAEAAFTVGAALPDWPEQAAKFAAVLESA